MWARHASPLRIGGLENPPSVLRIVCLLWLVPLGELGGLLELRCAVRSTVGERIFEEVANAW